MRDRPWSQQALFASGGSNEEDPKNEWGTPQGFFDMLDGEFAFGLDLCARSWSAKCSEWLGPDHPSELRRNAFSADLDRAEGAPPVWCNPPYGTVERWLELCSWLAWDGRTVVALVFARTDTVVWHDIVMRHALEVRLVKGRLKFEVPPNRVEEVKGESAPAPSAVVVFQGHGHRPLFRSIGRGRN